MKLWLTQVNASNFIGPAQNNGFVAYKDGTAVLFTTLEEYEREHPGFHDYTHECVPYSQNATEEDKYYCRLVRG